MSIYKCGYCGYEGPCYGTPFVGGSSGGGVSAPWCPKCGINSKLVPVEPQNSADSGAGEHISQQIK
jgi:hypothetical protein